jgi:hypothetical protein
MDYFLLAILIILVLRYIFNSHSSFLSNTKFEQSISKAQEEFGSFVSNAQEKSGPFINSWHRARGDILRKEIDDLVLRSSRFQPDASKKAMEACGRSALDFFQKYGSEANLSEKGRRESARKIRREAKKQYDYNIGQATGQTIFALYLEAGALPGPNATYVRGQSKELLKLALESYVHENWDAYSKMSDNTRFAVEEIIEPLEAQEEYDTDTTKEKTNDPKSGPTPKEHPPSDIIGSEPTLTPEDKQELFDRIFEGQKKDMLSAGLTTMGPERQTYETRDYLVECAPEAVLVIIRKHDGFAIIFTGSDASAVISAVERFGGGTDELNLFILENWSASMIDRWSLVPIETLHRLDTKVVRQLQQKSKAAFDLMCDSKEDGTISKDIQEEARAVADWAMKFYTACTAALSRDLGETE